MRYKLRYLQPVQKQLTKKMDPHQALMIVEWMKEHIDGSTNPRVHGKALTSNLRDLWRYRVGKYRVICVIKDGVALVLVIGLALRKMVYNGKTLLKIKDRARQFFNK